MKYSKEEVEKAREALLGWLKPGDTVYTIVRKVSRSGMQRHISLVIFRDNQALHPNYSAAALLGYRVARGYHDALVVNGCGMDMCFHVVYSLGRALWPKGFCQGGRGKKAHKVHSCPTGSAANGCTVEDSGYALHNVNL